MDLEDYIKDFTNALKRLKESYNRAKYLKEKEEYDYYFFRDSTIQRFEFTVEISWKCLKKFLKEKEGIICNSPKSCIKEFFRNGYIDESQSRLLLKMIDDRNMTSHTYHEEVAEIIFSNINGYIKVLEKVIALLNSSE